jgi:hypothetical protein
MSFAFPSGSADASLASPCARVLEKVLMDGEYFKRVNQARAVAHGRGVGH